MRFHIFVRTAILILVNVGASFGVASHTRREERMDTIPTRAETTDGAHGKDNFSFDSKDDEARGPEVLDLLSRLSGPMIDKTIEELSSKVRPVRLRGDIHWIIDGDIHWRSMANEAKGWLEEGIDPPTVFKNLKLDTIVHQDMDVDTIKYNPTLILWFHYVTEYRLKDITNPNHAAFTNKKLLEFLAEHIRVQNGLELTLSLHGKSRFNPYVPVVSLFDSYRNEAGMKYFAAEMLAYMVTDSITKKLVFDQWLLKKGSPEKIFEFLLLNEKVALRGTDDVTLFTAWLDYVKKCLKSGALRFDIGSFIEKQLPQMSAPRAVKMFESDAIENVLGDVKYQTGNLAAHVRGIWQRFPQILFSYWGIVGEEITSASSFAFVTVIKSIALSVESKPFNGDEVFNLLNVGQSFEKVVELFRELGGIAHNLDYLQLYERALVETYAHTMVQYLLDSSFKLRQHEHPKSL